MADYLLPPSPSHLPGSCTGKRLAILPRSISCNHSCPDHCGCIYAKLDYVMVIGTDAHEQIPQGASAFAPESPLTNGTIDRPAENHMKSWQLNCKVHVYQGRIYSGFDETELCNVKLTVSFENYHSSLIAFTKTVSPCWNETMQFINVPYMDLKVQSSEQQHEQRCTIMCILQAEGKETTTIGIGWIESDIIDRTEMVDELPSVESTNFSHLLRTTLRWVPFYKMGVRTAEVLLSSEVVKAPSSMSNRDSDADILVTPGLTQAIAPTMYLYQMEILFFGLRQLNFKMRPEEYKSIMKVMIGEIDLCSGVSGVCYGGSTNFPAEKITCTLHLPSNSHYWPLIVIKHLDYSDVNRNKTIGVAIINHSDVSIVYPRQRSVARSVNSTIVDLVDDNTNPSHATNVPYQLSDNLLTHLTKVVSVWQTPFQNLRNLKEQTAPTQKNISTDEGTWWTSFYKSLVPEDCHEPMVKIYTTELEKDPKFNGFRDWSGSYPLYKVKNSKELQRKKAMYGVLKCKITFTPIKETPAQQAIDIENGTSRIREPVEVTVVVYVVQALNLTSRDIASESDAYIVLTYGKECVRDRAYYIPNQSSPVFGRRFEMRGLLPRDQILHLSIYDRDFTSPDDLIGSTCIDIEDRFWSKHLPGFGLPKRYRSTGSNRWRHASKPSEMLVARCVQHGLGQPTIRGQSITVGGVDFEAETIDASECVTEQLCLLALNRFEELPDGFPLTPEHVETRSLYHPKRAGIEQGKVQLWVEVYEPGQLHPQPLDITPQPPQPHELRVIVWNTADVVLDERNIFGTEMSDIYVKCWLQEFSKAQHTDVHYRSLTGEGNFNWRMIFPFRYSPADGMLVVRRKKAFYEQYDTELKFPPVLTVQVWDNDSFSADDFLGTVDLNLARLPPPAPTAERCKLDRGLSLTGTGSRHSLLNLFHRRHVRGWFPVHGNQHVVSSGDKTGNRQRRNTLALTGKIELELEILSKEDATQTPVGRGRESPQHLPDPLRPEVSFNWLQQPARTFNKLLWPRVRRSFVWVGVMLLLCLLAYGLVVNLPTVFMMRTLDQRKSSTGWSSESRSSVSNG
ncbi:myoferlin-like [Anopheles ziemanni]|uniref:myoferlin-like n=1 Tax=Anopheles coustani TaxID=139045 RepID=UPI002658D301|nr:myoferlin-like [Anopheles coustani]XP_058177870.1 myoferlin-like [Anopheles ziemanni]